MKRDSKDFQIGLNLDEVRKRRFDSALKSRLRIRVDFQCKNRDMNIPSPSINSRVPSGPSLDSAVALALENMTDDASTARHIRVLATQISEMKTIQTSENVISLIKRLMQILPHRFTDRTVTVYITQILLFLMIPSTEHVMIAHDENLSEICMDFMKRGVHEAVLDNCARILAVIAQSDTKRRNILNAIGAPEAIYRLLQSRVMHEQAVSGLLYLSNALIEGDPAPNFITLQKVLRIFELLLAADYSSHMDLLLGGLDTVYSQCQTHLVSGLAIDSLIVPVLRCFSKQSLQAARVVVQWTMEDVDIDKLVACGLMQMLPTVLYSSNKAFRSASLNVLANIAAEANKIPLIFDENLGLLDYVDALLADREQSVVNEAMWVIYNILSTGSAAHKHTLAKYDIIGKIVPVLDSPSLEMVTMAIKIIHMSAAFEDLTHADKTVDSPIMQLLDELDAIDKVRKLYNHSNEKIHAASRDFLDEFFDES